MTLVKKLSMALQHNVFPNILPTYQIHETEHIITAKRPRHVDRLNH